MSYFFGRGGLAQEPLALAGPPTLHGLHGRLLYTAGAWILTDVRPHYRSDTGRVTVQSINQSVLLTKG